MPELADELDLIPVVAATLEAIVELGLPSRVASNSTMRETKPLGGPEIGADVIGRGPLLAAGAA